MLGVIATIVVYAAGWIFVHYTPVGGDDNHVWESALAAGWAS